MGGDGSGPSGADTTAHYPKRETGAKGGGGMEGTTTTGSRKQEKEAEAERRRR